MNSQCSPGNRTRYDHQEKCRRLKESFLAEKSNFQGAVLVDKNENIVNRNAGYYFSNKNVQNQFLAKETPLKVKAHITGLPQPQIVQKVSFSFNNSAIYGNSKENCSGKIDIMQNSKLYENSRNATSRKTDLGVGNKRDDAANGNIKDPPNESAFVKAKRALFSANGNNNNTTVTDHSKSDKRFDVKMMHSFSVRSNQNEKNPCAPCPRAHLHPTVPITQLSQKKDKIHSGNSIGLESDFLIDDEIADQPNLITFEKADGRTRAKFNTINKQDSQLEKNHIFHKKSSYEKRIRRNDVNSPNHTSDSYYYMYNQLVPDVRSIKSSVLHLKRLLSQNSFYHQLAETDQRTCEENVENELILEQLADMKRQVVYLEEQLRDRDRTISQLQRQMCGMALKSEGRETCGKATQT